MASIHGTSPLFNFGTQIGEKSSAGNNCVLLQSKKGLVRLKTDAIVSLKSSEHPNAENIPDAIEEVEKMLDGFSNASKNIQASNTVVSPVIARSALILQCNSRILAFDIEGVEFIEHHQAIHIPDANQPLRSIVTLQNGDLANGIPLGKWLDLGTNENQPDLWSIGYGGQDYKNVITVNAILGIESIPTGLFYAIKNAGQEELWINHPTHGAIRLLNVVNFTDDSVNAITEKVKEQINHIPSLDESPQKLIQAVNNAGLGIHFGPFGLVLPTELIAHVNGKINLATIKKKPFRESLAAYNLSKITELNGGKENNSSDQRSIAIRSQSKRNIIFIAPNLYEPNKELAWEPLPILPKQLGKFINALRLNNGRCEMLLNPSVISNPPQAYVAKIAKSAFCGWLKPL